MISVETLTLVIVLLLFTILAATGFVASFLTGRYGERRGNPRRH